ncbi:MAG: hypothetical protein ACI8W7_003216, partial [Gammaproteobacteria bacterium]
MRNLPAAVSVYRQRTSNRTRMQISADKVVFIHYTLT